MSQDSLLVLCNSITIPLHNTWWVRQGVANGQGRCWVGGQGISVCNRVYNRVGRWAATRSLQKIADSIVKARAFNKYGQITDVSDQTLLSCWCGAEECSVLRGDSCLYSIKLHTFIYSLLVLSRRGSAKVFALASSVSPSSYFPACPLCWMTSLSLLPLPKTLICLTPCRKQYDFIFSNFFY